MVNLAKAVVPNQEAKSLDYSYKIPLIEPAQICCSRSAPLDRHNRSDLNALWHSESGTDHYNTLNKAIDNSSAEP